MIKTRLRPQPASTGTSQTGSQWPTATVRLSRRRNSITGRENHCYVSCGFFLGGPDSNGGVPVGVHFKAQTWALKTQSKPHPFTRTLSRPRPAAVREPNPVMSRLPSKCNEQPVPRPLAQGLKSTDVQERVIHELDALREATSKSLQGPSSTSARTQETTRPCSPGLLRRR